jgi:glycosyltransferase involved in cell wall biosynthesis
VNTFVSHGRVCEACRGRRYYRALLKRCRRGSILGSAAYALGAYLNDYAYRYDRLVARYITPSDFLQQKMISFGYPAAKFVRLPNAAFDPPPALGDSPPQLLLYAGRLAAHKGVDLLVRAAAGLELPVVIAGDGPERGRLEALAESLPTGRVRFTGRLGRSELAGLYRLARLSVVPSRWFENGPLAVLEAYAQAVPVVGARIGALPEFIEEGRTGALFRPGDPDDLREVLRRCLADPKKLGEMGRTARERALSRYAPEIYAAGLERILTEVCAERQ